MGLLSPVSACSRARLTAAAVPSSTVGTPSSRTALWVSPSLPLRGGATNASATVITLAASGWSGESSRRVRARSWLTVAPRYAVAPGSRADTHPSALRRSAQPPPVAELAGACAHPRSRARRLHKPQQQTRPRAGILGPAPRRLVEPRGELISLRKPDRADPGTRVTGWRPTVSRSHAAPLRARRCAVLVPARSPREPRRR